MQRIIPPFPLQFMNDAFLGLKSFTEHHFIAKSKKAACLIWSNSLQ